MNAWTFTNIPQEQVIVVRRNASEQWALIATQDPQRSGKASYAQAMQGLALLHIQRGQTREDWGRFHWVGGCRVIVAQGFLGGPKLDERFALGENQIFQHGQIPDAHR